jgi:phenylalanyl-tRNA synthetase beta chain
MAVVEFLISDFERLCGFPKDKIIEGLTEIGAPCEEEKGTKKLLVELTPNRPDWFALEGLSRSLRSYYRQEIVRYAAKKGDFVVDVDASVEKVRPYTACAVVRGLRFSDERIIDMVQVQEKLVATLGRRAKKFGIGIYPLEKISFPVAYTTMKPDQIRYRPLGWENEATAPEIVEKHPKGLEHGHIIKNFPKWPVFVDAKGKVMALLPVVNSAETGQVGLGTNDVFIEVSGIDGNSITAALNILATMFADMGGTVYSVEIRYPHRRIATPDLKPKKMKVNLKDVNMLLGLKLAAKDVAALASRMGYEMEGSYALVPPYRADVIHEVDVIEDIAIAYGYNKFVPKLPDFFTPGRRNTKYEGVNALMRGMGFLEATTFILTNRERVARMGYEGEVKEIENPSGEEFTCLRPTLLADLMAVFETNKNKGLPQKIYELGVVYEADETGKKLVFGIMDRKVEYSEAKGYLQSLVKGCGGELSLGKTTHPAFDSGRSGAVFIGNKKAGVFGKVRGEILKQQRLEFEVYACELDVEMLV